MRKIIQICAIPIGSAVSTSIIRYNDAAIYALCNDDTVWARLAGEDSWTNWIKLPDIPQDEDYTCVVCRKKITENPVSANIGLHPKQGFKHATCNFRSGW